jgi:predicted transcriptional regulator YdeE
MEPKFADREPFTVMGLQRSFTPENEDFEAIWKDFMEYHDQIAPHSTDAAYYGVCFGTEDEHVMEYVAGMAVGPVDSVPEGLVVRQVPAAQDAVFECTVATIHDTYEHIFHEWLPPAPYEGDKAPAFEHYPPNTTVGTSPVFIHIPVVSRGGASVP